MLAAARDRAGSIRGGGQMLALLPRVLLTVLRAPKISEMWFSEQQLPERTFRTAGRGETELSRGGPGQSRNRPFPGQVALWSRLVK